MTRDDLRARIHAIVADTLCLEPHEVQDDATFSDLTDDFGKLEIIMAVEDLSDVEISDEAAEAFKALGDLISYVAERLGLLEAVA